MRPLTKTTRQHAVYPAGTGRAAPSFMEGGILFQRRTNCSCAAVLVPDDYDFLKRTPELYRKCSAQTSSEGDSKDVYYEQGSLFSFFMKCVIGVLGLVKVDCAGKAAVPAPRFIWPAAKE